MEKIIRFKELRNYVPLSRSSLWRLMQKEEFPKPISLSGLQCKNAAKGWLEQDIIDWIKHREELKNDHKNQEDQH